MKRKNPHAVALGRKGGLSRSPAKLAAIRINAQKAGRKPKFEIGERVTANEAAPASCRGRTGTIVQRGPGRAEYGVLFTDDIHGTEYLMSWWLEKL